MMQQANLSDKNAFCRFALGTSMTAFGIAKVSRNPNCLKSRLMIALGAMKMAEGIFKYCPAKAMLNTNVETAMNTSMQSMFSGQNSMSSEQNPMSSEQIGKLMKDFSSAITGNSSDITASASNSSDTSTSNQHSSDSKNSTTKAQNPS